MLEGELKVDESQLTGEADEGQKGAQDALMSGNFVIAGQGLARLDKVGERLLHQPIEPGSQAGQVS